MGKLFQSELMNTLQQCLVELYIKEKKWGKVAMLFLKISHFHSLGEKEGGNAVTDHGMRAEYFKHSCNRNKREHPGGVGGGSVPDREH